MQKKNLGKEFEQHIKDSLTNNTDNCYPFSIDRLPDPVGGYVAIRNICDFTGYRFPFSYFLECKCKYGNTLNFKGAITTDQWEGLTEKSKVFGTLAGFCVWFIDYDTTIFIPIQEMNKLRYEDNKKSLNIKDVDHEKVNYFDIEGKKNRVYFNYNHTKFVTNLENMCKSYWNIKEWSVKLNNE